MRHIMKKSRERNIDIHYNFIDFKATFEAIWQEHTFIYPKSLDMQLRSTSFLKEKKVEQKFDFPNLRWWIGSNILLFSDYKIFSQTGEIAWSYVTSLMGNPTKNLLNFLIKAADLAPRALINHWARITLKDAQFHRYPIKDCRFNRKHVVC